MTWCYINRIVINVRMVRALLYIFSCYIFDFGAFLYKQNAFFEARQSWLGLGEGMYSPEFIYLIQESKIHSTGLPRLLFLPKNKPPPPPLKRPILRLFGKFSMKKTRQTTGISKLAVKMF